MPFFFPSSHFIFYNSQPTVVLSADSMKKALLFSLQNTNMVFGSEFLNWRSQRQHNLCCKMMKRQSTVLQVSHCSTNAASFLASLQDRREVPVVEKHGWKHYNMAASLAPPAESLMHRYILCSQKCADHTPEKPAFSNLQGTALLSSPGGTCWHRGQKRAQQEENLR